MASYPPRLYNKDARCHLQVDSMNHNFFDSKFSTMKKYIGIDVWNELRESCLGVFVKLKDIDILGEKFIWSSYYVHFFLTHQLAVKNIHEFWSLIDDQPIRFSLHEFKDITGLNCDPYPLDDPSDACDYAEFWEEMKVPLGDGPTWEELVRVLKRCQSWSKEKRKMLGRLCILHVGIHGINHGSRIPLSDARRVLDEKSFEKYLWGRVGFTSLITSIKVLQYKADSYTLHGCVNVLAIWLFESVPALGEMYGFRRNLDDVPPLLNWRGSRKRFRFEDLIGEEKGKHGKVRVRHMLQVSLEHKYPMWSDNDKNLDVKLDKLIDDIIGDSLVPNAWPANSKTSKSHGGQTANACPANSKTSKSHGGQTARKRKKSVGNEHSNDAEDNKVKEDNLVKVIQSLVCSVGDLGTRMTGFETNVHGQLATIKEDINDLRVRGGKGKSKDISLTNSNKGPHQQDDEASSKTPIFYDLREEERNVKSKNVVDTNSPKKPQQEDHESSCRTPVS